MSIQYYTDFNNTTNSLSNYFAPYSNNSNYQSLNQSGYWSGICCSNNGQYIYTCISGGNVYINNNYGTGTWNTPLSSSAWNNICCTPNGQYVFVGTLPGKNIYYSTNYGVSFSSYSSPISTGLGTGGLCCSDINSNIIYLFIAASSTSTNYAANQNIYMVIFNITNNSFTSYNQLTSTAGWYSIACSGNGTKVYAVSATVPSTTSGGNIYYTNNGTSTTGEAGWVVSLGATIYYIQITTNRNLGNSNDGQYVYAAAYYNGIYFNNNYGNPSSGWPSVKPSPGSSGWVSVSCSTNGQYVYCGNGILAGSPAGLYYSNNFNSNWTYIYEYYTSTLSTNISVIVTPAQTYLSVYYTIANTQYGTENTGIWIFTNGSSKTPLTGYLTNDNTDLNNIFAGLTTNPGSTYTVTNYFVLNYTPLWTTTEGNYDLGQIFQPK